MKKITIEWDDKVVFCDLEKPPLDGNVGFWSMVGVFIGMLQELIEMPEEKEKLVEEEHDG